MNAIAKVRPGNGAQRLHGRRGQWGNGATVETSATSGEVRADFPYDALGVEDDELESELADDVVLDELEESVPVDEELEVLDEPVVLDELEDPRASFL